MSKLLSPELANLITRRQWLLRLGEAVALAGVSGVVPRTIAETLMSTNTPGHVALPPGLYLPSPDHLAHALEAAGNSHVHRPGSETEYVQLNRGTHEPQFFSKGEFQLVTRLVKIILGEVSAAALSQTAQWVDLWLYSAAGVLEAAQQVDPLHRSLAVAYYGEAIVKDLESFNPQVVAHQGIAALQKLSTARYGNRFSKISKPRQMELVDLIRTSPAGTPLREFFDLIHKEAVLGYYTSADGLKELNYKGNTFHGQCPGCTNNQRTAGNV